jgi:signal transduction histidine kinase
MFTTKTRGMGMGLAICKSIIESHNGRIWVTAGAPGGSIFQFELPTGGTEH